MRLKKQSFRLVLLSLIFFIAITIFSKNTIVKAGIISPPYLEVELEPGKEYKGSFDVIFRKDDPEVSQLYLMQSKYTENSEELQVYDFNQNENTLVNWITLNKKKVQKPTPLEFVNGDNVVAVDYTINIPYNAPPGAHYATILVSQQPPEFEDGVARVALGGELAYQLFVRIKGTEIVKVNFEYFQTINNQIIFPNLSAGFETKFINQGNIHIIPVGNIEIFSGDEKIDNIEFNEGLNRIFPDKYRIYYNYWNEDSDDPVPNTFFEHVIYQVKNFRIGQYTAKLGGFAGNQPPFQAEVTFWVIPIHLIISIIVILFILWMYIKFKKRRRKVKKIW